MGFWTMTNSCESATPPRAAAASSQGSDISRILGLSIKVVELLPGQARPHLLTVAQPGAGGSIPNAYYTSIIRDLFGSNNTGHLLFHWPCNPQIDCRFAKNPISTSICPRSPTPLLRLIKAERLAGFCPPATDFTPPVGGAHGSMNLMRPGSGLYHGHFCRRPHSMWRSLFLAIGMFMMFLGHRVLGVERMELRMREQPSPSALSIPGMAPERRPQGNRSRPLVALELSLRGSGGLSVLVHDSQARARKVVGPIFPRGSD